MARTYRLLWVCRSPYVYHDLFETLFARVSAEQLFGRVLAGAIAR